MAWFERSDPKHPATRRDDWPGHRVMRWTSALSERPSTRDALDEVFASIDAQLDTQPPDLLVLFVHPQHQGAYDEIPRLVAEEYPGVVLLGCSAGGVVGGGREVEHRPAVSLTAAVLPDVEITPFHLGPAEPEILADTPVLWHQRLQLPPGDAESPAPNFLLLPDPFSCDAGAIIRSLDRAYPASVKVGGLASGGQGPGDSALFVADEVRRRGAVGVALRGAVSVETIVAQGCRPIGEPLFVTMADGNFVYQLEGRRSTDVLLEIYESLTPDDQELARHSLFLGVVMEEGRQEYRQGEFLIRNLMGMDPDTGVLAVGERLHNGQVVQFHLRDARTSAQDLDALLTRYKEAHRGPTPEGALLFSCLGRGAHLYGEPDHDTRMLRGHLGGLAVGGFFCNGEIGPVGGRSYLHGYTSSIALFRPRD